MFVLPSVNLVRRTISDAYSLPDAVGRALRAYQWATAVKEACEPGSTLFRISDEDAELYWQLYLCLSDLLVNTLD